MELLNVNAARSTWLFDVNDLNPKGKTIFPRLIEWLRTKYAFGIAPASATDVDKEAKGWIFKQGSFQGRDGSVHVELTVYGDGLAANTYSSTRDTDAFLEDVLTAAVKELSLQYKPSMVRQKIPLSEITIRLERSMSGLNPLLIPIAKRISELSPDKSAFEVGGISFWTDTSQAALKLAAFQIERRVNAPFSENRFYSKASLHTDDHLSILAEFEGILA